MPRAYVLTPRAVDDLDEIWAFIGADSKDAADRVESAIFGACQMLARNPLLGSRRSEITSLPVRFWVVDRFPNFIVVYRPETRPLEIVSVVHGKRDLGRVMRERAVE